MARKLLKLIVLLALVSSLGTRLYASATSTITLGGAETQLSSGAWDSGSLTISFADSNGHVYSGTVTYGQFSTPASLASAFAANFSNSYVPVGLCAHASGSSIVFYLKGSAGLNWPSISNPSVSYSFNVSAWPPAAPVITWATPAAITYGTALSATQLDAAATVSGTGGVIPGIFSYSPPVGVILTPGSQPLSVIFTPTNTTEFTTVSASATLTVNPLTPAISIGNLPASAGSNGSFTVAYSYTGTGSPTETVSSSTPSVCTVSGNTVSYAGTGTCTLQASATATAYYAAVTGSPQSFSVCASQMALPARDFINTIAGDGSRGYSGDSLLATSAALNTPYGVAVDTSGNVYIADTLNSRIREVSTCTGDISTVAGDSTVGYSGDGGPAADAELFQPYGVAVDSAGNIYIADSGNNRIREVSASTGIISTVAGNGTQGYSGDGGAAASAELNAPYGIAVDGVGNIYIADAQNNRIRKVTASTGIISTVAGNGTAGYSGDGGTAANAEINYPLGVALDTAGNIYIADTSNNRVREVNAVSGVISTLALLGPGGYMDGQGGPATSGPFFGPSTIALDSTGNLYMSGGNQILEILASSGVIRTVAGYDGVEGYAGDGGASTNAVFDSTFGVAVDGTGNIYIADESNERIRVAGDPKANTSISVSCPNFVPFGTSMICTATVTGNSPTGTVSWGLNVSPASTVLSGGSTSVSLLINDLGWQLNYRYPVTAFYTGDDANSASSASTSFIITQGTPAISVYDIPSIAYKGYSFTATYNYSGAYGAPTETVSSSTPSVCVASGSTVTYAGVGTCTLTASATATADYLAVTGNPQSFIVSPAPTINIGNIPSSAAYGTNFEVEYSYSGTGWPTESVSSSTSSVCTVSGNAVSFVGVGTCTLTAAASPTIFYYAVTGTSQSFTVNVAYAEISVASSNSVSHSGVPVILTATVTHGDTNAVTFYNGGSSLGTVTPVNGTATLTTSSLPAGANAITASIAAGGNYTAATSSAITQTVNTSTDAGTVTLTVSNSGGTVYTAATNYGQGSTPESIASALAGANTSINVAAVNDTLYIEAAGSGGATTDTYSYAVTAQSSQGFTQPSFQGSPASGNLAGGANTASTQQPVYNYSVSYDPASNVSGVNDSVMGAWTYSYDTLNRLAVAATTQAGNAYPNYCWSYDSFGNRLDQTSSSLAFSSSEGGGAACALPGGAALGQNDWAAYNGTTNGTGNNQMSATSQNVNQGEPGGYDAAGDVLNDGHNQYLYDAEGRICAESSTPVPGTTLLTGYVYDAEGNRVAKGTIANWSCDPSSNGLTAAKNETDYILGPGGEQVTEVAQDANGTMNWQRTYVHAGSALIATYESVPNPQYNAAQYNPATPTVDPPTIALPSFRLTDWLGSMRVTTDASGVVQGTCTGLPFGDGQACNGNIPDPHHFTGKERDTESGNDYFGARYYASSMGRFLSPDWSAKYEPVPYAKLDNPQSLNLYAYVLNNPLSKTDPDGHDEKKDQKLPPPDAQHDHTITVRQVSGQGVNVAGHATVQIDGGKEVGYGPKQDMTSKQVVENTAVPGTVEPRAANAKTEDQVTIHVTGDQANAAQKTIDGTAKKPGNYVLHGSDANNCANFAEKVVNSAGGSAPHDTTPGALVNDIRNQQYKDNSVQTPTPH